MALSPPPMTTARVSPQCIAVTPSSFSFPRKNKPPTAADNGEIDVFSAEKYFSGTMDDPDNLCIRRPSFNYAKDAEVAVIQFAPRIEHGTPSVRSDGSANSRSSLLTPPRQRNPPPATRRSRRLIDIIRCNCSKSVQVNAAAGGGVPQKPCRGTAAAGSGAFGSPIHGSQVAEDGDAKSDASSDLFEIESISAVTNRAWTDSTPTCYEPSEASVEWSVATASVAMDGDCGDCGDTAAQKKKGTSTAGRQQHRGGVFAGCSSNAAVNVASNALRVPEKVDEDREWPEPRAATATARISIEEWRAGDMVYARPGGPWAGAPPVAVAVAATRGVFGRI